MKKKNLPTQITRSLITALALLLTSYLANAQPKIATPDGFAGYAGTTGGGNATPVTVSSASAFKSAVSGNSPKVIYVNGFLNVGNVSIGSNKTIVGMTESSGIGGGRISVNGSNYIFQNLIVGPGGSDVMEVSGGKKVFITKCSFHDCGDELLSIVRGADFVTISWCKFYFEKTHDHALAHLIGNSDGASGDNGKLNTTMHHNWYAKGVRARMPRVRYGKVHIYNNYYNSEGNEYGIGVGVHCKIRLENSHFKNMNRIWNNMGGAKNGKMGWKNLILEGCSQPTFISNSFPVFNPPYSYSLDPVNSVESIVRAGAGNVIGDVPQVPVTGVAVKPTSASVNVGNSVQLTASVSPSNATNKSVSWSSSNTSVASVNSSGLVTGVGKGTATITVKTKDGGFTASSKITVNTDNIPVTGVKVTPTSASVSVGNSVQLTASVSPSNATNKTVSWSSSNTSVASVNSSGLVTGVGKGTATITVKTKDGGFTASSKITVNTDNIPVTGVKVAPTSASVSVGNSVQLTASVSPSNATNKTVSWKSSNTSIATVSSTGTVKGVKAGNATITVKTQDGGFTASCKITVEAGGGSDCDNPEIISIPFKYDGAGEYCWATTTEMAYINSWNLEKLTINGEDFTNVWSNSLPPAQNGQWVIHYVGNYDWSHFEAPAAKNAGPIASGNGQDITIFPNPYKDGFYIDMSNNSGINRIDVINPLGQVVESIDEIQVQEGLIYLKTGTRKGQYLIRIHNGENIITKMIIKE